MVTLLAFDTSYLYFRAFFGVPDTFRSPDGRPVNAVRGTLDFMSRLLTKYPVDECVAAWDEDWRPQWRVDLIESYKTHRVVDVAGTAQEEVADDLNLQVPLIRECLDAVGMPVVGVAQHEADDVLASVAAQNPGQSWVVTGDRDLFQLINERTSIVYVARSVANHDLLRPADLVDKYGLAANRYVDFAVLRGDPSDGLPGVKGIGEKTAATLVNQYPTLEDMMAAVQDPSAPLSPSVRKKLADQGDYLAKAREVVTCVADLQLPPTQVGPGSPKRVAELTEQHGLGGSLSRLATALHG